MRNRRQLRSDGVAFWNVENSRDYAPVKARLPTVEESVTQIGRGSFEVSAHIASTEELTLLRYRCQPLTVGLSVLEPGFTAFVLPISWGCEFRINGQSVKRTSLYLPVSNGVFIRGDQRDFLAIVFRAQTFIDTLAALRGIEPDDIALNSPEIELGADGAHVLQQSLIGLLAKSQAEHSTLPYSPNQFENDVMTVLLESYLKARPERESIRTRGYSPEAIVRKVEEHYEKTVGDRVSLADLCKAAHVSKSTLYTAFNTLFGVPPLEYLHKRRLMDARSQLLQSSPKRGAIKYAAMSVGLTELGRFSAEYRSLFGESPSATLSQNRE